MTTPTLQGHYDCHYLHFLRYAKLAGVTVEVIAARRTVWCGPRVVPNHFSVQIGHSQLIIDFADLVPEGLQQFQDYPKYLKYQYYPEYQKYKNIYPSGPPFLRDDGLATRFFELIKHGPLYTIGSDIIRSNQRAHTRALQRRTHVQRHLSSTYLHNFDADITDPHSFWQKAQNTLVQIVVPGACNSMLDRGHIELLGLGVPTISPLIVTYLPYFTQLTPWEHYIPCLENYGDLLEKIEWCRGHRQVCREIGRNTWELFQRLFTPRNFWAWIESIL